MKKILHSFAICLFVTFAIAQTHSTGPTEPAVADPGGPSHGAIVDKTPEGVDRDKPSSPADPSSDVLDCRYGQGKSGAKINRDTSSPDTNSGKLERKDCLPQQRKESPDGGGQKRR